jgi:hypothetical protein
MHRLWYGWPMRSGRYGSVLFLVLLGCGGAVEDPAAIVKGTGGYTSVAGIGGYGSIVPLGSGGTSSGGQVYSTYTSPGCPDAATAQPTIDQYCDLFSADSGCGDSYGCFPLIQSSSDPCQPTRYLYACIAVGTGTQAQKCDDDQRCAAGYICVITSTGTVCQRACDTTVPSGCAPGMFCDPIDVPGVGTCS